MSKRIRFTSGTVFQCPEQAAAPVAPYRGTREWRQITVTGTAADVKAAFVGGATYSEEWDTLDANGDPAVESRDLSDYCIAGDVVDTRDGNVTVYMGKKTEAELQQETIDALLIELLGV